MPDQLLAPGSVNYDGPRAMETTGNGYIGQPIPPNSNTIRRIEVNQLSHGYVVSVGCQSFAIENPSTLIAKLAEYINNPSVTEQKWNEGKLF